VDKGYFQAAVQASTQQLADKNYTHQFVVTFHIAPGPRYHLGQITFKGNRAIADTKALRDLFPTKDGSILDRKAIASGLENLRYAYGELGYINFTSVPTPRIDEDKKLVYFDIDVDEGKTFYISSIDVVGADPRVLDDFLLKPGQVYNVRLVDQFLRKHLPDVNVNDPRIQQRLLDEQKGTVALSFDFRSRRD
jgi:outer membrane protein insertion porin family